MYRIFLYVYDTDTLIGDTRACQVARSCALFWRACVFCVRALEPRMRASIVLAGVYQGALIGTPNADWYTKRWLVHF